MSTAARPSPVDRRRRSHAGPGRLFDSPEQEAYLQLWRTYDRLRELEERVFVPHGLNAQQYNALRVLRSVHPAPLAASALGARLVSRAPDMTRLLDRLEDRGLVERQRSVTSRRSVEVRITAAGRRLVGRLAGAVRRCGVDQLGHLDRSALARLIELLRLARAPHEREAADAWPGNAGRCDTGNAGRCDTGNAGRCDTGNAGPLSSNGDPIPEQEKRP